MIASQNSADKFDLFSVSIDFYSKTEEEETRGFT